MVSVNQLYHEGRRNALDGWNGGEGRREAGCRGKVGLMTNSMPPPWKPPRNGHVTAT